MLAAGALRAVRVDLQVALVDLDVGVVGQERRDDHGRERGVPAVRAVERALADEPVLAALGLEDAVGVLAADVNVALFRPASSPGLASSSSTLKPRSAAQRSYIRSIISAQSCASVPPVPDWSVTTASPGVVLAVEQRRLLEPAELAPQRDDRRLDLGRHARGRARAGSAASSYSPLQPLGTCSSRFATRECSVEIFCARSWSSQKPGSLIACSSSADAAL